MEPSMETWQTIGTSETLPSKECITYYPKRTCFRIGKSNVGEEFLVLVRKMITEEDFVKGKCAPTSSGVSAVPLFFVVQLSSDKTKLRFVISKDDEAIGKRRIDLQCNRIRDDEPDDFSVWLGRYPSDWAIDTLSVCSMLGTERMVFVDSSGAPTRKPTFEIAEDGDKITITGSIKGITKEEFAQAFPPKKKTPTPQE